MENIRIEFGIESGKYKIYVDDKLVVDKKYKLRFKMYGGISSVFDRIPKEINKLKKEYFESKNYVLM